MAFEKKNRVAQAARRTREALLKGTDRQKDDSRELNKDDSCKLIRGNDTAYPNYVFETDAVPRDWEKCNSIVVVRGGKHHLVELKPGALDTLWGEKDTRAISGKTGFPVEDMHIANRKALPFPFEGIEILVRVAEGKSSWHSEEGMKSTVGQLVELPLSFGPPGYKEWYFWIKPGVPNDDDIGHVVVRQNVGDTVFVPGGMFHNVVTSGDPDTADATVTALIGALGRSQPYLYGASVSVFRGGVLSAAQRRDDMRTITTEHAEKVKWPQRRGTSAKHQHRCEEHLIRSAIQKGLLCSDNRRADGKRRVPSLWTTPKNRAKRPRLNASLKYEEQWSTTTPL